MKNSTSPKTPRKRDNPPVVAREYLESLGYRITDEGLENEKEQLKILRVEREDDGSPAEFAFCSNMAETVGMVLPRPFSFYRAQMMEEEDES